MTDLSIDTRRTLLKTVGVGLVSGIAPVAGIASGRSRAYRAELEPGIDDDASGRARFTLRENEIEFSLSIRDLDGFESALLLAGTGGEGTESQVILDEVGRYAGTERAFSITGTITDEDVTGGDSTVAELSNNIERGEDPRVWVFIDSEECAVVPSGECIPGLGLRGGLSRVKKGR